MRQLHITPRTLVDDIMLTSTGSDLLTLVFAIDLTLKHVAVLGGEIPSAKSKIFTTSTEYGRRLAKSFGELLTQKFQSSLT